MTVEYFHKRLESGQNITGRRGVEYRAESAIECSVRSDTAD